MPAEMQPLIEALNALIAKLDAAALAHRTFIANAAHQLRTPLTALQPAGRAGAALRQRSTRCGDAVVRLQDAVHRATRLANQLLLLSRAEPEAQSGANRRRTDLYELAFETARAWVPAAMAASIDLGFDEALGPRRRRDRRRARRRGDQQPARQRAQVLPAAHARHGVGAPAAASRRSSSRTPGRGIAPAERSRVVQRFYRGDNASEGGTGLGLAIANEIALAHAGQFAITDAPGGGARFEIRLPAA